MYVEERMHRLHPGKMAGYLKIDGAEQADVQNIRPAVQTRYTRMIRCALFFVARLKKTLAAAK